MKQMHYTQTKMFDKLWDILCRPHPIKVKQVFLDSNLLQPQHKYTYLVCRSSKLELESAQLLKVFQYTESFKSKSTCPTIRAPNTTMTSLWGFPNVTRKCSYQTPRLQWIEICHNWISRNNCDIHLWSPVNTNQLKLWEWNLEHVHDRQPVLKENCKDPNMHFQDSPESQEQ